MRKLDGNVELMGVGIIATGLGSFNCFDTVLVVLVRISLLRCIIF